MTLTVDDRELIGHLRKFNKFGNGHPGDTRFSATAVRAADRLQSLLSDRDKLERERDHWKAECKALCELVSRYVRPTLTQTEVP